MLSLSPAKLLVILVIALIVLGPEKLPQVARQLGAAWHDLRQWRSRIESEVRGTFPNLPPTHEVAQAVRSPFAFLDRLADEHERQAAQEAGPSAGPDPGRADVRPPPGEPPPAGSAPVDAGTAPEGGRDGPAPNGAVAGSGNGAGPRANGHGAVPGATVVPGGGERTPGGLPSVPDDPSMN